MRIAAIALLLVLLALGGLAQRTDVPAKGEFHFLRLEYTDAPQYHRNFSFASRSARGNGWWMVDWPDADEHFALGVQRLTRIESAEPVHFSLNDDRIFNYPWIYATQTGWWGLSDSEVLRLREYLARGGFLVVDDMWGPGPEQWENFTATMQRALASSGKGRLAKGS